MTGTPHISPDDLALVALGALSPEEAAVFAPHLAACEQCRHELAELRGDMSLLAMTAEPRPLPEAARARFLASIGVPEKQADPQPAPASVLPMPLRPASSAKVRVWQAIAALLLIALALHAWKVGELRSRLHAADAQIATLQDSNQNLIAGTARARQVLEVLTAPSAQRVVLTSAHPTPEPEGHLTYIAESGSLIFQASHLRPLPQGKTYELWVIPENGKPPVPAGLFQADATGNGGVVLPKLPEGLTAKAFGVTMEQASGSATPTLPILMSGAAG